MSILRTSPPVQNQAIGIVIHKPLVVNGDPLSQILLTKFSMNRLESGDLLVQFSSLPFAHITLNGLVHNIADASRILFGVAFQCLTQVGTQNQESQPSLQSSLVSNG